MDAARGILRTRNSHKRRFAEPPGAVNWKANRMLATYVYPVTKNGQSAVTSSRENCRPFVHHSKIGLVLFPTTQQVNLLTCSPHCPYNAERRAGKLCIPILKSLV